jgi:hypothetical protein
MSVDLYERRQPLTRQSSFSGSTVASSVAAEIVHQHSALSSVLQPASFQDVVNSSLQNNVKIDHAGDIIYNFYTPPAHDGLGLNFDRRKQERNNSSTPTDESVKTTKNLSPYQKICAKRFLVIIIIAITVIGISLSVTFYLFMKDVDKPDDSTTTISGSTTTPATTPTETPKGFEIIKREDWLANKPDEEIEKLEKPIKRIIIAHTADELESCLNFEVCKYRVKNIQSRNTHLQDIPYNFLIGADGNVYEGRGFDFQGQHTTNVNATSYDEIGICVAFIGTFENQSIYQEQIEAFQSFIDHFVIEGNIAEDYKLFSQDQLSQPAVVEAVSLFNEIKMWKNFYSGLFFLFF